MLGWMRSDDVGFSLPLTQEQESEARDTEKKDPVAGKFVMGHCGKSPFKI